MAVDTRNKRASVLGVALPFAVASERGGVQVHVLRRGADGDDVVVWGAVVG